MRVCVDKEKWEWFKTMQAEARTRPVIINTFRTRADNSEIELEITEIEETN